MSVTKVLSFLAVVFLNAVAATYPSKYPFEKEDVKPPALPDTDAYGVQNGKSTKEEATSANNPGGYINRFTKCDPYSDERASYKYNDKYEKKLVPVGHIALGKPAGWGECRINEFLGLKGGWIDSYTRNCTEYKQAKASDPSMYPATVGGKTICNDCCKHQNGMIFETAGRIESAVKEVESFLNLGQCPTMTEIDYCKQLITETYCMEYFPKGKSNERTVILPCYDNLYRYFLKCPLFKATKLINDIIVIDQLFEPKHYIDSLSPQQNLVLKPLYNTPDKICNPYSYYNPESPKASNARQLQIMFVMFVMSCV